MALCFLSLPAEYDRDICDRLSPLRSDTSESLILLIPLMFLLPWGFLLKSYQ